MFCCIYVSSNRQFNIWVHQLYHPLQLKQKLNPPLFANYAEIPKECTRMSSLNLRSQIFQLIWRCQEKMTNYETLNIYLKRIVDIYKLDNSFFAIMFFISELSWVMLRSGCDPIVAAPHDKNFSPLSHREIHLQMYHLSFSFFSFPPLMYVH